jgi:hypothetical protein
LHNVVRNVVHNVVQTVEAMRRHAASMPRLQHRCRQGCDGADAAAVRQVLVKMSEPQSIQPP